MTKYLVTALLFAVALLLSLDLRAAAASGDVPECVEVGTAEGQTLYLCETTYGVRCVWDPSELLSAGVVDCEW